MGDPRRVTQELVEIEYQPASIRRVTQILVEVEYLVVPDEAQTQVRGHDQIQPWSITSDRLSQEVAGDGLRGGGPEGPLWVDAAIYPQPTAQGQALVSNVIPQWTASLTPTWLGAHTFSAGLGIAAAQAITMGDEAYIGCGPADVRIVFDAGNDIALMGGNVGVGVAAPVYPLDVNGTVRTPIVHNAGAYDNSFAAGMRDTGTVFGAYLDARGRDFVGQEGWVTLVGDSRNVAASAGQISMMQYDGVWQRRLTIAKGGNVGVGVEVADRLFHVELADSATNSVTYAQRLSHITDGTVVAGFGTGIEFELEENGGNNRVAASIEAVWSDAGEGTNADSYLNFRTMLDDVGSIGRMAIGYNGNIGMGTGTMAPTYPVTVHEDVAEGGGIVWLMGIGDNQWTASDMTDDGAGIVLGAWDQDRYVGLAAVAEAGANFGKNVGFAIYTTDNEVITEKVRVSNAGLVGVGTPTPDRLFHAEVADSATNTIVYAERLTHATDGTPAALYGVGQEFELEDAGGNPQVASELVTLWATATAAAESPLFRGTNYPTGSAGPGYWGFWTWDDLDDTVRTVVPNGTGDVTNGVTITYRLSESGGGTDGGVVMVLNGASVSLYDDGTDRFDLTVNADGSVTVVRAAGAATADVALFMVWI